MKVCCYCEVSVDGEISCARVYKEYIIEIFERKEKVAVSFLNKSPNLRNICSCLLFCKTFFFFLFKKSFW